MTLLVVAALVAGCATGLLTRVIIERESDQPLHPLIPVVATGLLAAVAAWRIGWSWDLPAYLYFAAISIPLTIIDLRTHRLPNPLTLTAYPIVAGLLLLPAVAEGSWEDFGRAVLAGAALLAFFGILHVINPTGMGLGDVKLSGPMGAVLGWASWNALVTGTLAGFLLGAVVGLTLMVLKRANRKTALPFGPFMLTGAWVAILLSPSLL